MHPVEGDAAPIELVHTNQHMNGLNGATVDRRAILKRRDEWVSHYDDTGQVEWAQGAGLRVERSHAQLIGERQVLINGPEPVLVQVRQAVVIAAGSQPFVPSMFADVALWSSRDATGAQKVPESLVIVGGGVVAVEAATWMAALGTRVRMLVRGGGLLAGHEPFAGQHVTEALERAGVRADLRAEVTDRSRQGPEDTGLGRIQSEEVTIRTNSPGGIHVRG